MAPLLTLTELRSLMGIDPTNTLDNATLTAMLAPASAAVSAFTERDFGSSSVVEQRTFDYDGSGFLDIDDASAISAVTFTYPNAPDVVLDSTSWKAMPPRRDDSPVFYYIQLPEGQSWFSGSPEMGFTRNLDVFAREYRSWPASGAVKVDGTWGWPVVPDDVKMAVAWTVQEWIDRPSGDALTSEAIAGWSRVWGNRNGQNAGAMAVPGRAQDLLARYAKIEF